MKPNRRTGGVLLSEAQNTRKGSVRRFMRSLEAGGADVLGNVMNNVKVGKGGYYGGYTYSQY